MDFTLTKYKELLLTIKSKGYIFERFDEYIEKSAMASTPQFLNFKTLILRHDVDRMPQNALKMAKLEHDLGIKTTYYFRTIPQTFKPEIIKQIVDLGHEIGYHYENLSMAGRLLKKSKPNNRTSAEFKTALYKLAMEDFKNSLECLRELYPVRTMCKHGAPLSEYDNGDIWKEYDYKKEGIIGEPNFDINWNEMLYISDAARAWNNKDISRRDKVNSSYKYTFNNTKDIIDALNKFKLPSKIMINIHPEHWAESNLEWLKIWIIRKIKNTFKKIYLRTQ